MRNPVTRILMSSSKAQQILEIPHEERLHLCVPLNKSLLNKSFIYLSNILSCS